MLEKEAQKRDAAHADEIRAEIEKVKKRLDQYVLKAEARLQFLRHELKMNCDHKDTSDYSWEWDSGYGNQKQIAGLRCNYCRATKSWKSMSAWTTADE